MPTVALIEEYIRVLPWSDVDDLAVLAQSAWVLAELGAAASALGCCELIAHSLQSANPRSSLAHGSRLQALTAEAQALALRHDAKSAAEYAARAYADFQRLGFQWRAVRMATVLYQTSHARRWLERAQAHLAHYPQGAFPRLLSLGVLTQREREVLQLLRGGETISAIGDRLDIGASTVRTHMRNIYHKYGARSYVQLLSKSL